jgi:hypothetical protein
MLVEERYDHRLRDESGDLTLGVAYRHAVAADARHRLEHVEEREAPVYVVRLVARAESRTTEHLRENEASIGTMWIREEIEAPSIGERSGGEDSLAVPMVCLRCRRVSTSSRFALLLFMLHDTDVACLLFSPAHAPSRLHPARRWF